MPLPATYMPLHTESTRMPCYERKRTTQKKRLPRQTKLVSKSSLQRTPASLYWRHRSCRRRGTQTISRHTIGRTSGRNNSDCARHADSSRAGDSTSSVSLPSTHLGEKHKDRLIQLNSCCRHNIFGVQRRFWSSTIIHTITYELCGEAATSADFFAWSDVGSLVLQVGHEPLYGHQVLALGLVVHDVRHVFRRNTLAT